MLRSPLVYEECEDDATPIATTSGRHVSRAQLAAVSRHQFHNQENVDPVSGLFTAAVRPANSPLTPGAVAAAARAAGLLPDAPTAGAPGGGLPWFPRLRALTRRPASPAVCRARSRRPEGCGQRWCVCSCGRAAPIAAAHAAAAAARPAPVLARLTPQPGPRRSTHYQTHTSGEHHAVDGEGEPRAFSLKNPARVLPPRGLPSRNAHAPPCASGPDRSILTA